MNKHKVSSLTSGFAASMTCILVSVTPVLAKSKAEKSKADVAAVSGTVTGNVQKVGFRAMIQKQAIQYNLAGITENNFDGSVRFSLQGDSDRIKQALKAMKKGPKRATNVKVSTSSEDVSQGLATFQIVGWTSVSRHILTPYTLVFSLRSPDSVVTKKDARSIWLKICEDTVQGEDIGKCDKDKDHED